MKRLVPIVLFAWFPLAASLSATAQAPQPAQAAADAAGVVRVDNAFIAAVAQGDNAAALKYLDSGIEFTNVDGKTFTKSEMAASFPHVTTDEPGATHVHAYNYGRVADVEGIDANTRFLRIWIHRPDGWRLFNYIETPIGPKVPLAPAGPTCDNPCHTIPYTPTTEMDKQILDAWHHAKMDEWHPNSKDWALRVGDEFSIINSGTDRTKATRVAMLAKQQQEGQTGPPGDPIHDIRMFDIGKDAAVMLSKHTPHRGGKPYYNVRLWILRDARWQLVASQQTTIQAAAPVPPSA